MALINCPECSKSISDQSTACPSCGFPTHRAVTCLLQQEDYDDNDSLVSSRQRQKNSGFSGATIFLIIIIVLIGYWLINDSDDFTEKSRQYSEEQSEPNETSSQTQELVFDSSWVQIPMSLSGSGEDGRYFLISNFESYGIKNVKYARRGNTSDSFGEMQIDCADDKIRKTSSNDLDALISADLGDWYTPTPDWTDQDIVNFICK